VKLRKKKEKFIKYVNQQKKSFTKREEDLHVHGGEEKRKSWGEKKKKESDVDIFTKEEEITRSAFVMKLVILVF